MNPVIVLTRNNLALTKRCIQSLDEQDIPNSPYLFDNGSTDGTWEWMEAATSWLEWQDTFGFGGTHSAENRGVSYGWNFCLRTFFETTNQYRSDHVLVVGNDTVLPRSFYRTLLSYDAPFVTGIAVDNMEQANQPPVRVLTPNPDFSAFLIRRDCWEKVGPFDERMKHYCSDCDMHIRAHRMGVPLMKSSTPFYHERSSTLRLASPEDRLEIETQANKDRQVFQGIYGCLPGSKEYEAIFL